jgi:Flp pilus assembly protein TadG
MLPRPSVGAFRRGVAAAELALVLPFIMIFLLGTWEVGRVLEVQQIMNNAAREAGRQASAGQLDNDDISTLVKQYVANEGLLSTNAVTAILNKGFPGNPAPTDNNPQNATDMDMLEVTVTIPFKDVRWVNFTTFTSDATVLSVQATWASMKDRAYTIPTPPTGS